MGKRFGLNPVETSNFVNKPTSYMRVNVIQHVTTKKKICKKKKRWYLNESKQQAPTVVRQIVLCSRRTFDRGIDRVMLHDFLSAYHDFPMLQQWLKVLSKFPGTHGKYTLPVVLI